jgi:hypothetical protein
MRDERSCNPADKPCREDVLEHGVLTLMLDCRHLHIDELVRELGDTADDVNVAVTALLGAGLLHRHDGFVFPTRAAVRFSQLGT